MKKLFLIILLFLGFIIQTQAQNDTLAVLVWVEDAVGNRDSVFIYLKGEATDGLDPELGEVNLYGTPPQSDLDLRIIQRTDTNYYADIGTMSGTPWWLTGMTDSNWIGPELYFIIYGWCSPYSKDVDLKKNYVGYNWQRYGGCRHFEFRCHNINPPVVITLEFPFEYDLNNPVITFHETNNGSLKTDVSLGYFDFDRMNYCGEGHGSEYISMFNHHISANLVNDIIHIEMCPITSIWDSIEKKTLFPNPANDFVALEGCEYNDEYGIFDINGNMVTSGFIDNAEGLVNISGLLPATYHIKVKNNIYKLIKIEK